MRHSLLLEDSREFQQVIDFYDYPFSLQIRHKRDPLLVFADITNWTFSLDQKPSSQIAAGVILLLFSLLLLGLAGYKTYRFCIKYTLRDYIREKRRRRYLAKEEEVEA